MKDYSFSADEKRKTILNYKVSEKSKGKLELTLGTGEIYLVDDTEKNITLIREKMINQILRAEKKVNSMKGKMNAQIIVGAIMPFITMGMALIYANQMIPGVPLPAFLVAGALPLIVSMDSLVRANISKSKINDLEKNLIFLKMESEIKQNLLTNDNILLSVSKSGKKVINSKTDRQLDFTDLDSMTLDDLRTLKANIERDKAFGFETDAKAITLNKK